MASESTALEIVRSAAQLLRTRLRDFQHFVDEGERQTAVDQSLADCLSTLTTTDIWGEANRPLSSHLWNVAGDLLETGWLQARARHKPRGYAGDHELLHRIAERKVCEHPLGRCFDQYFQSQAAPQAVRNRIVLAADWIAEAVDRSARPVFRMASVGAGPAIDVAIACRRLSPSQRSRLQVALLDMDGEALDLAAQRLSTDLNRGQVTLVQGNIFRLNERPTLAQHLQDCDLILCTGLFDYLPHASAVAMLGEFWNRLAPAGQAFVFNFAPHNPTRAYMEWIGNWYLLYRCQQELSAVVAGTGISRDSWALNAEPLGIDFYVTLSKPGS